MAIILQIRIEGCKPKVEQFVFDEPGPKVDNVKHFKTYRIMIVLAFLVAIWGLVILTPVVGSGMNTMILYLASGWVAYTFLSVILPIIVICKINNMWKFALSQFQFIRNIKI